MLRRTFATAKAAAEVTPTLLSLLPSGLRIVTQSHAHNKNTATVSISLKSGSRYESRMTSGTAHFLEHMHFKGTAKRQAHDFAKEVEDLGASLGAYTSREITQFSITVPAAKVERGLEILSDIVLNPLVTPAAISSEVDVITQEAKYVCDNFPEERLYDLLHSAAFHEHPLGFNILGEAGNHRNLSKTQLDEYRDKFYVAPRVVLSAAGNVKHEEVVKLAEKYLAPLDRAGGASIEPTPAQWAANDVRVYDDDKATTNVAIAFQGPGIGHVDALPLMLLQSLLQPWRENHPAAHLTSNKLGVAAQKPGVHAPIHCHSVDSFFIPYSDVSLVGFHFSATPSPAMDELVYNLMNEFVGACFVIADNDLERAKNALKTSFNVSTTGANRAADDAAKQILYFGRRISPEEMNARIDQLTAEDIKAVCKKYIYDRDPAVAVVGKNIDWVPDYNAIRSWTFWLTA